MDGKFELAVRKYWETREQQTARQIAEGKQDAGLRGAVTGGAHLDALTQLIVEHFVDNLGYPPSSISLGKKAELPANQAMGPHRQEWNPAGCSDRV